MLTRKKLLGTILALVGIAIGMFLWFRTPDWKRCCAEIIGGMTVDQVREIMGRDEDESNNRTTAAGEVEKSWTFEGSGVRITVVFNQEGNSTYKEFAPSFCGVTPLMGKLIPKKIDDPE